MVYIPASVPAGMDSPDEIRRWVEGEFARLARSISDDELTRSAALAAVVADVTNLKAANKIVTFTRNLTTATGSQIISGVGFKPRFISFQTGIIGGGAYASAGQADGTTNTCLEFSMAGAVALFQSSAAGIQRSAGADFQSFTVSSFDADGFTLSWTKVGAPTGTVNVSATCVR